MFKLSHVQPGDVGHTQAMQWCHHCHLFECLVVQLSDIQAAGDVGNTQWCHLPRLLTVRQPVVVTKPATYFDDCHESHLLLLMLFSMIVVVVIKPAKYFGDCHANHLLLLIM